MRKREANALRDRALAACPDEEAAQAAWARVAADGRCHGKTRRACRVAMLAAIADGRSIEFAERAARDILEN